MDQAELLSRMKVRIGICAAIDVCATRVRRCSFEAEEAMVLLLELASARLPRELDATLNPTEAILDIDRKERGNRQVL